MNDTNSVKGSPKGGAMAPNNTPATPGKGYLGVDLGDFQMSPDECKKVNGSGSLVRGLEVLLFPQCQGDEVNNNQPILSIKCEGQTKDGVTWDLKHETGEINTNCPNETRYYTKKEMMTVEVGISAITLNDEGFIGFSQGMVDGPNGNKRAIGYGAIRNYILVLLDRESGTMAIYPNVQYKPESVQIKYTFDSEPTSKIMFQVSKTDLGDGQPFFYEVRKIEPKAA
jgi:hypothetical protein